MPRRWRSSTEAVSKPSGRGTLAGGFCAPPHVSTKEPRQPADRRPHSRGATRADRERLRRPSAPRDHSLRRRKRPRTLATPKVGMGLRPIANTMIHRTRSEDRPRRRVPAARTEATLRSRWLNEV
jgi:hypothetical protein